MISFITGENTFENERTLARIAGGSTAAIERYDGEQLELRQLPDLLMGSTLFTSERLVVIKRLSENKTLWNDFEVWIERISPDTHLVLVEMKPDKRTKTYKMLQKVARSYESRLWTDRDGVKAEQWVGHEAAELGFELDKKSIHTLVSRVGMDQWALFDALRKLEYIDKITPEKIEETIEANPLESVFGVFDAILKADAVKADATLTTLRLTEDPYRLFGLLSTQVLQFIALTLSGKPSGEVAKEIGAHPFALSGFASFTKQYDKQRLKNILTAFAEADSAMKTSSASPWLCLEKAVLSACHAK